jgi:hypothetical protein
MLRTHALLLVLFLAACGDAPKPAPTHQPVDPHAGLPNAPSSVGQLPADHPPIGDAGMRPDPTQFAGRVVLKGSLAQATTGALFITLHPAGSRMPIWSYKVDLDDPAADRKGLAPAKDGTRELTFALNQKTTMFPGNLPQAGELELAILYDPDKSVDSKEGQVRVAVPAKPGDVGLLLELDPDAAK